MRSSITTTLFCSALLTFFAGCAATNRSASESTVSGITSLQADLTAGKQQSKAVVDSLTAIEKAGAADLKPLYDTFQKELKSLESLASRASSPPPRVRSPTGAWAPAASASGRSPAGPSSC